VSGPDPVAHARLLCDWCLSVGERDQVLVRSTTLAAPLLLAVQAEILERGGWPLMRVALPGQEESFHAHARDHHLDEVAPATAEDTAQADAFLAIQAPENTRALAGVDPDRLVRMRRAAAPLLETRMQKRWCGTIWPTQALAQDAGMSLADYAAFVERALFLDRDDPAAAWRELGEFQAGLVERLTAARRVRIEAEGTDLTLDVGGRTWVNSDGKHNMPSGEVFTGPVEDSAEGVVRFTIPTGPAGVTVTGVELEFRAGEVVRATAELGQDYLDRALATDPGARRLGELGVGTNAGIDRPTGTILLDEKIGGTVHLALGRSYTETGGVNESALHWDLICDLRRGGRLTADDEVVQADGVFR
jgi:aminopeptidase